MSAEHPTWLDRMTAIGGALVLILVIVTVFVAAHNRGMQTNVAEGQAKLTSAQAAGNVNATLIRMLASAAADNNDDAIKSLLATNGVTFKQGPKAADAGTKSGDDKASTNKDASK